MVISLEKPVSLPEEQAMLSPGRTQELGSWFIDINESPIAIEATKRSRENNRQVLNQPEEDPARWIIFNYDENGMLLDA